jgi:hypothetical protein
VLHRCKSSTFLYLILACLLLAKSRAPVPELNGFRPALAVHNIMHLRRLLVWGHAGGAHADLESHAIWLLVAVARKQHRGLVVLNRPLEAWRVCSIV